jgi:N-acetylmuramoyl-L-alanine amidase
VLPTATSAVVAKAGPVPVAWQGGVAVPFAPRWWPRGKAHASAAWLTAWPRPVQFRPTKHGSLSGLVIALDPGHDVGNSHHVALINKRYWVGLWKTCNTTGTATNSGYPEATYNFDVVARLRRLLVAYGATVMVTRDRNTVASYGPCIGARGAFGSQEKARFMVQVHADGGPSGGHGFHAIVPAYYKGYTDDIYRASRILGLDMIAGMKSRGFRPATYLSTPLQVKKDTGAQNMSDVPIVTIETLNMRNAADARIATTATGRQRIALGLFAGIVRYYRSL